MHVHVSNSFVVDAEASKNPRIIYSQGPVIWSSSVTINEIALQSISLNESIIIQDQDRVQSLGFNYAKDIVYMGDVSKDVIYYTNSQGKDITELTVNTRHVEGRPPQLWYIF